MRIKDWNKFQHFKDRRPPWIKLHRETLDQRDIMTISSCHFRLLVCLWMLASEDEEKEGRLPSIEDISFRIRMPEKEIAQLILGLTKWVLNVDIKAISERYQLGLPETETETETYKPEAKKEFTRKKPSGDHAAFIDWFTWSYEKLADKPYHFTAKDAAHVKAILKTYSLRDAVATACTFFLKEDSFLAGKRDIGMLLSQINKLPSPRQFDPSQSRELGILPPEGVLFDEWDYRGEQ